MGSAVRYFISGQDDVFVPTLKNILVFFDSKMIFKQLYFFFGGDLASTRVAKPEGHAEDVAFS